MIQDIAPERFSVAYDLHAPTAGSLLCLFRRGSVLAALAPEGGLCLPRFCEMTVSENDCIFLFSISGQDYFWCRSAPTPCGGDYDWRSLRRYMTAAPQRDVFAALTARHLARWYETNRFCGCCGGAMARDRTERALRCGSCGNLVYPRINPAIIVGVTDGERLLLTRYAPNHGPTAYYALVAGFCEIGETAEDTVRREVMEEVGLRVKNIRYYGSQPWGIDSNLSLGYFAELDGSDRIRMDGDELSQALWVARGDIPYRGDTMALTSEMMEAFRLGRV